MAQATRFCAVAPNVCGPLVIQLCHPSDAYNIEVAARFLGNLETLCVNRNTG